MIKAIELAPQDAYSTWPAAELYLRRAVIGLDPEGYLRNIQAKVFAGINTLWQIEDNEQVEAYAVTGLYTMDGLKTIAQLHLMTADDMEKILPLLDQFHVWAIKHGASWLEIVGRKGWERKLRPYGYRHEYTSVMKRVNEELH